MRGKGFTLVELLVVISIIAILAAIGMAVFRGISTSAKDVKKRGDIDAITKVLESKYNSATGQYPAWGDLADSDFTSGKIPTGPDGSSYSSSYSTSTNQKSFQLCTTLSDNTNYCRSSTFGPAIATPTSMPPTATPTNTPIPTSIPTPTPIPPTSTPTPTPSFMYVFTTSTRYDGNLGGLSGADVKCQERAQAAGLPGTYKAWLSDNSYSPSTRMNQYAQEYKRTDGIRIADNWQGLVNSTSTPLQNKINRDEFNQPIPAPNPDTGSFVVWTATNPEGTANIGNSCNSWTNSTTSYNGNFGDTNCVNSCWTKAAYLNCAYTLRLYCIQQ